MFYLYGKYVQRDINRSIYNLESSALNLYKANFYIGCIYFKRIYVNKDIEKAIKYYKEGSSFNDNYCKNNFGIIYKNCKKNNGTIEYFKEAIS